MTFSPDETKEGHWKRFPFHRDLVTILQNATRVPVLMCDDVFVLRDRKGVRPLLLETAGNPWPRAYRPPSHFASQSVDFFHQVAFPQPPMEGLQGISPMVSALSVYIQTENSIRAAASAASQPACPAPTTIMSTSGLCMLPIRKSRRIFPKQV